MIRWWRRLSIRLRLTIWYAATLLAILVLYGGGVLWFVERSLSADLDRRLLSDFEIAEIMLEHTADGKIRWRGGDHPTEEIDNQMWAEVWTRKGELVFRSAALQGLAEFIPAPVSDDPTLDSLSLPGDRHVRFLMRLHSFDRRPVLVRVFRSEERLYRTIARLALVELLALPLGVIIAALGGYTLARRALDPVARMTEQAGAITAERLDERLGVDNPDDELGHLAGVFNQTFARLERSFEQLRRFTADASHELRTPLTSIRSVGEVALGEPRDEQAYREVIGSMLEEADRLARLVDSLLTITRADSGHAALARENTDLAEIARSVIRDLGVLAEEKGQSIAVEAKDRVMVTADGNVLRGAVLNLVDNAVKYSLDGTTIRIVVSQSSQGATLEVIDQGPGIGTEHQGRIFERFYRVDKSRSREKGGAGLGLSIAKWAVEAHGGNIGVKSDEGRGSTFRVLLPVAGQISKRKPQGDGA